jgi:FixJ family two-component response regulator
MRCATVAGAFRWALLAEVEGLAHLRQRLHCLDAALTEQKFAAENRPMALATDQMALFSPREGQVLEATAVGRPIRLIAYDLGVSVGAVGSTPRAHAGSTWRRDTTETIQITVTATLGNSPECQSVPS